MLRPFSFAAFVRPAAFFLLAANALPAAAAQVSIVGSWKILSGQSSSGPYCTMQTSKRDRSVGLQVVANGKMFLSLGNPDWSLTAHERVPVKVAVDGAPLFDGEAIVVLSNVLVIPLPPTPDPVASLAGGKTIVATLAAGPLTVDLGGVADARDALKSCLDASRAR